MLQYLISLLVALFCLVPHITAQSDTSAVDMLWFENSGFNGYYSIVSKVAGGAGDTCSCEVLSDSKYYFSGTNAPLDQPLSVHFRGPLKLHKFAYYTNEYFVFKNDTLEDSVISKSCDSTGCSNSYDNSKAGGVADANVNDESTVWERKAFYSGADASSDNVTFLTKAGEDSWCLGKALAYADETGTGYASSSTTLKNNTLLSSDDEFVIFSNISCPESDPYNRCGVYRDGIPAFEGFYGTTKMFLFEFDAPTETNTSVSDFTYYDMPAIWLLNSQIPRQSQYPMSADCSCWGSGCGEFDIFEITKRDFLNEFYSTFHVYQGAGDLSGGLGMPSYVVRNTTSTMVGGVVFDSEGNTVVFVSDSLSFGETIPSVDIQNLVSPLYADEAQTILPTVSMSYTATASFTGSNLPKSSGFSTIIV